MNSHLAPEMSRTNQHFPKKSLLAEENPDGFRAWQTEKIKICREIGVPQADFKAAPNIFAVMSTIGITRSYAIRVGPITPSTPTTVLSIS